MAEAIMDLSIEAVPSTGASQQLPIVVDLDGTLTPTDTLLESLVLLIKTRPARLLALPAWLLKGRAAFKCEVAASVQFSAEHLPLREPLIKYLSEEKAKGREIVLATAAHRSIAASIAQRTNLFDRVLATDELHNLKGVAKLAAIQREVGEKFIYVGDSEADMAIWRHSAGAIVVGSRRRCERVRAVVQTHLEFPVPSADLLVWARAIRAHQWLKNLLMFVPLLTSFSFMQPDKVAAALLAFVSFCFGASATYIVNDLWDIENDRRHPRKRLRPLASALIGIPTASMVALTLLLASIAIAWSVGPLFLSALITYLIVTSAYSWTLKKVMLIDVLVLAGLYTLRIIAGSFAIGVSTSSWLLTFSMFMFLSLALVKRCSELFALEQASIARAGGRNYYVRDLPVLQAVGIGAGLCSIIVFSLFVSAMEQEQVYKTPELMWLAAVGLLYWLGRLWIKTARGEMHDDPLVFAVKDFGSQVTVAVIIAVVVAAHSVTLKFL